MITVASLIFNAFRECTCLVSDGTGACLIVDPGNSNASENERLSTYIDSNGLKPCLIVITHAHVDHVVGVKYVQDTYRVPVAMHGGDAFLLDALPMSSKLYGFDIQQAPKVDIDLSHEKAVRFGDSELQVLHVPGHSPGHIALYSHQSRFVIVGDVLFAGSIGRTDLPGGDYRELMTSIIGTILSLGPEITVYPGHGRATTISQELDRNPFIREVLDGEVNF